MKKFLIITSIFLFTALLLVVGVFLYLNSLVSDAQRSQPSMQNKNDSAQQEEVTDVQEVVPEEGIPLRDANLNESQKKALDTVGIDSENFVITPSMISCGTEKLGEARMMEIANGDTPTALETARLLPCLGAG